MSKIFKPRRGKASTMAGTKASTVLAAGEMFIELPDAGAGMRRLRTEQNRCRLKGFYFKSAVAGTEHTGHHVGLCTI